MPGTPNNPRLTLYKKLGSKKIHGYIENNNGKLTFIPPAAEDAVKEEPETWVDYVQYALSLVGVIPGFGDIADVVNAGISFMRGNYLDGFINLIGAIPVVGSAISIPFKAAMKGIKGAGNMLEAAWRGKRGATEVWAKLHASGTLDPKTLNMLTDGMGTIGNVIKGFRNRADWVLSNQAAKSLDEFADFMQANRRTAQDVFSGAAKRADDLVQGGQRMGRGKGILKTRADADWGIVSKLLPKKFTRAIGNAFSRTLSVKELGKLKGDYTKLTNLQRSMEVLMGTYYDSQYLIEKLDRKIKFIPLKVDKLAGYIFDNAEKVVIMSATIIDPKNFCKTLGIDKYKYIEVESTFDPKNAPIFVNTKTKLSFNNLKQNLPKIKKQIQEICEFHKTEKGLIHTHTNTITYFLKSQMHGERFLFREPGINNEKLLDKHYNTDEPTVLISPSMSHGVDLKDDLARFQIIVKAPFLPMKEKRIESIMKLDKHWYINKMLSALIQACGRGVRSPSDHCTTYILDGTIIEKVIENKDKLPKYFLDRFV
jgi:Rad3-related DNA helicase